METMVYPVPSPAPAAYLTLLGVALFLTSLALGFAWLGWSMSRVAVAVDADSVELRAPFYGRTIPRSSLLTDGVRVVDLADEPDLHPGLRTNGVGLPGFLLGWFRLASGDRALLAVTDRSQVLYLPHADGVVLASVSDPVGLVAELRAAPR